MKKESVLVICTGNSCRSQMAEGYLKHFIQKMNIDINIFGTPALPGFSFKGDDADFYRTLFTYSMMKKNILASNIIFTSIVHDNEKILNRYFDSFYETIKLISDIKSGKKDNKKLINMIKKYTAHSTFKRLN